MENPIKMDDLGGKPTIFGNIHIWYTDIHANRGTCPPSVLVSEFWGAVCQIVYPFSFQSFHLETMNLPFHAPP